MNCSRMAVQPPERQKGVGLRKLSATGRIIFLFRPSILEFHGNVVLPGQIQAQSIFPTVVSHIYM